jgi:hypothetical protein
MARAAVREGVLRGCPTCGTKVADVDIGLRDFRWVNEYLPGKVGGMDIDFMLTQSKTDRVLLLEMKPAGARISVGARLTFQTLIHLGADVMVVWDQGDGNVDWCWLGAQAELGAIAVCTQDELAARIKTWWEAGCG